jgi:hypothetical protein
MNNVFLPLGFMAYGIYMLITSGVVGHDYVFWIKVIASIGGGLYLIISNNLDKFKDIFAKKSTNIGMSSHDVSVKNLLPTDLESKDYECIVHLRNRLLLAKSDEGLETLAKLDAIMFKLPRVNE